MSRMKQVFSNVINSETEGRMVASRGWEEGWEWGFSRAPGVEFQLGRRNENILEM